MKLTQMQAQRNEEETTSQLTDADSPHQLPQRCEEPEHAPGQGQRVQRV